MNLPHTRYFFTLGIVVLAFACHGVAHAQVTGILGSDVSAYFGSQSDAYQASNPTGLNPGHRSESIHRLITPRLINFPAFRLRRPGTWPLPMLHPLHRQRQSPLSMTVLATLPVP